MIQSKLWYLLINGTIQGEFTDEEQALDAFECAVDDKQYPDDEILLMQGIKSTPNIYVRHNPNKRKNDVYVDVIR